LKNEFIIFIYRNLEPWTLNPEPLTPIPFFIKYYRKLNQNKEKSPKVCRVFPDKELEGKITVTKGGGTKKTDCLPFKNIDTQDLKELARTPQ